MRPNYKQQGMLILLKLMLTLLDPCSYHFSVIDILYISVCFTEFFCQIRMYCGLSLLKLCLNTRLFFLNNCWTLLVLRNESYLVELYSRWFKVKNTAYFNLVTPKLEYDSSVLNPHRQCNIDKIEMVSPYTSILL